ncbi:response regulator transcription factor [Nonomuraea roseoviolacea subsp. roseoviolacea]|uniref:DNA-binding NarL/FixJ family response regulator n=1 Tax=Nonomuraea roseoviolacea subsp. carminata TaxID=160689 RepID=A0ABT1JZB8_9ACTN|nr:response regulator transcription factor [Nonomuraea roseoviolacea]MCP2347103.1 DNA-binding NarL/FixJ family response regulator [Nonomuraea roseoviolacea subsp. carminata]
MAIRVVVADDHAAVRAGIVLILGGVDDIEVVGEAADGEEAVALAREKRPDVVLMDVRMPRLDGISATRELAGVADVLILTTFDVDEYVFGALRAGAAGFLLKNTDAESLVEAVRVVARGDGLISPAVTRRLISAFADMPPPRDRQAVAGLTPREREVLACVARGLSNAEIAKELDMAEATTKTHVSRVLGKLGLKSRVQAAIYYSAYEG